MFGWLQKKPASPPFDDRVWLNEAARLAAVVRTAQAGRTLLVTFFDDTSRRVSAGLTQGGVPFTSLGYGQNARAEDVKVLLCAAERVGNLTGRLPEGVNVCVVEHHPLPETNRALLDALLLLTSTKPVFQVALDEPLLQRFGGDKLVGLMAQLEVPADEPIEHAMVTRALSNARDKVAARVKSAQPANSMEEWLQFNFDADRR